MLPARRRCLCASRRPSLASLPPPVHFTVAAVILAVAAVLLFMLCDWRSRGEGGWFLFLVVLRPARCTLPIWQLGRYCCRLTAGVFRRGSLLVQTGDDGMLVLWCVACMWCRQLDTEDREKALFITIPLSLFSLSLFFDLFSSACFFSLNRAFHFCKNDYIFPVFFY